MQHFVALRDAYLFKLRFRSCCSRACILFTIFNFSWTQHCWIAVCRWIIFSLTNWNLHVPDCKWLSCNYLDSGSYFSDVVTNVLLPGSFKRNFGAYYAHKDTDFVLCLVDLVTVPAENRHKIYQRKHWDILNEVYLLLYSLYSSSGDNISTLLEKKWNTISESKDV